MFLLVPAYPGCPGSKAVKRSLLFCCCCCPLPILGVKSAKKPYFGREQAFSSRTDKILKVSYYRNHCIDLSQFCLTIDTSKQSVWVVPTCAQQIQDGSFTDLYEIWYGDAVWVSQLFRQFTSLNFKNPRWLTAAILKTVKLPYLCSCLTDFDQIWHGDAHQPLSAERPLKFQIFENARYQQPPS